MSSLRQSVSTQIDLLSRANPCIPPLRCLLQGRCRPTLQPAATMLRWAFLHPYSCSACCTRAKPASVTPCAYHITFARPMLHSRKRALPTPCITGTPSALPTTHSSPSCCQAVGPWALQTLLLIAFECTPCCSHYDGLTTTTAVGCAPTPSLTQVSHQGWMAGGPPHCKQGR